jgi:hypothetical protein
LLFAACLSQAQDTGLLREVFSGIPGNRLADLTNSFAFPDRPTSTNRVTDFFEAPIDIEDEYGQRMHGYIVPPTTGPYVFWIASDDESALFLSTDQQPVNKRLIARVQGWTPPRSWLVESGQQSAPILLESGRRYYIEALMKEGDGGDNLAVRWQLPNGTIEEPVPASRLIPYGAVFGPPSILSHPTNLVVVEGDAAVFRVRMRNADPVGYQWLRNGIAITDATQAAYTNGFVRLSDDDTRYRCLVTNALGSVLSEEAVLRVMPDTVAPTVSRVYNAGATEVYVVFSEPVLNATRTVNYALDGGISIVSAAMEADSRTVRLTTSPLVFRRTYTLTINNLTDRAATANRLAPNTRRTFIALEFTPTMFGEAAQEGQVEAVPDGVRISASGRGPQGRSDELFFLHQLRAGNFDVQVRVPRLDLSDLWGVAGLMVRERLTADAGFAAALATPSLSGCFFAYRPTNGALVTRSGSFPVNYPETWLRLRRSNDVFFGYASWDGQRWTSLGTTRLALSNTVYLGYAVASGRTNQSTIAEIGNLLTFRPSEPLGLFPDDLEPLGPSSRRTGLVISEIMYHPQARADGRDGEFIELSNTQLLAEDLSGYRLAGAIDYVFPSGSRLEPGDFLVVARSPADLAGIYGPTTALGGYAGRLENGAGRVQLLNRQGAVLLDAAYGSEPPWPAEADGAGHSLVLGRASYGEGDYRAWVPSNRVGGTPGRAETWEPERLRAVRINEFLAHTDPPLLDYVELYNRGNDPLDLSGCALSDNPSQNRFVLPPGTLIPARGFLAFNETRLGFALSSGGEAIYLRNREGSRVLDALRFGPQANGVASGRYPDGAPMIQPLATLTPGATNAPPLQSAIVINEIMYHPITEDSDDEFVELHNLGREAVNLEGWRLNDGIEFTFPPRTTVPAGGYLVVARNADRLQSANPQLGPTNLVGNYTGNLANRGERLALERPENLVSTNAAGASITNRVFVVVDEVTYRDGGRWAEDADGGGSSLELIDPRADNRLAANWRASDETAKSEWSVIEATGVLGNGMEGFQAEDIEVLLLGAGECLVDDVEVLGPGGQNLVPNPNFEGGITGWRFFGTHTRSRLETAEGYQSGRSLRLHASARGDTGPNQVNAALNQPLAAGATATLRARARWLRGHPELLLKLHGNYLEATGPLALPRSLGTPGAPNSRAVRNAGPAIFAVRHDPVLPAENEPVVISARVDDPDGLASVRLHYRADPSVNTNIVLMVDDGTRGDAVAGDGVFTATAPGMVRGHLVAFHIEATDQALPRVTSRFPAEPGRECLVTFGEVQPSGNLGTYRFWLTHDTARTWTTRERGSNDPLDITFAYGNSRVIYNAAALYSGSPFHWGGYDSPITDACNFVLVTPSDEPFLGTTDFVLNLPSNLGSDSTYLREQVFYWMVNQLGDPYTYRRFHHLYVNGVWKGPLFEDAQQPNREFVEQWYPDAPDGELYKIEDWFEYNHNTFGFSNVDATLERFTNARGDLDQGRYRWIWRKRAVQGSANDYRSLLDLVEAVNVSGPAEAYTESVTRVVDIEQWMRTMAIRHVVGDWDAYGYRRGKNMYAYKPPGGRWVLLHWDIAFSFGLGDGTRADLFDVRQFSGRLDPVTHRKYQHPPFRRIYLQALQDAARGPLTAEAVEPVIDRLSQALTAAGTSAASPNSIKTWIAARRQFILQFLGTNNAPFSVTSHAGGPAQANRNVVQIEGTAPLEARSVRVNGVAYPILWTSITGWRMSVPLQSGLNQLVVAGYDAQGQPLSNAAVEVAINLTIPTEAPEGAVIISEIQYAPAQTGAEFIEIHNNSAITTFDLSGWRLGGVDFVFPDGTLLPPLGELVVAANRRAFALAYGDDVPVAGEYPGRLDRGGETLRLQRPGSDGTWLTVDQVTYDDDPPWPAAPRTSGASLQVVDTYVDNARVGAWRAVDANQPVASDWQYVAVTSTAQGSWIQLSLTEPGEVYVDDIALVAGAVPERGSNLIRNGGFESPLADAWTTSANVSGSSLSRDVVFQGAGALRLVATAGGASRGESIHQALPAGSPGAGLYTLSFWYRTGSSPGRLVARIGNGPLESSEPIRPPLPLPFTPGAPNSVAAALDPFPLVYLSEIQPENSGLILDPAGEADPWLELVNLGTETIRLDGYLLSDRYDDLARWTFPAGTSVAPGAFLLVWLDAQPAQSTPASLHASFRPTPGAGAIALSRLQPGGPAVVDYLNYSGVLRGASFGRIGGDSRGEVLAQPTPAATNTLGGSAPGVRINEWLAGNTATNPDPADGDFDDWFELFNPEPQPVSLAGWFLTDNLTNRTKFQIPAGIVIPARGFLLVWADEETRQNGPGRDLHVNFKLSLGGEAIGLFTPNGTRVDVVEFGPQASDVSQGRWPDGSENVASLTAPTPGGPNLPPAGGVGSLRIVESVLGLDGALHITWSSQAGAVYRVQAADRVAGARWIDASLPITAVGASASHVEQATQGQRFYRVVQISAP